MNGRPPCTHRHGAENTHDICGSRCYNKRQKTWGLGAPGAGTGAVRYGRRACPHARLALTQKANPKTGV